tara:strand:+ start:263 stop:694 length:432 start_codon:yes stop_codon:yes gene_type:complete
MEGKSVKNEKYNIITSYNLILKRIVNFYHEKCPNKDSSYAHIRRCRLFIDADPKSALEITGSKLFKYKDIIFAKRPDKISHTADDEKKETLNEYSTQKDIAAQLIENILTVWHSMVPQDKDDLAEQLVDMLKLYIRYLITEKA